MNLSKLVRSDNRRQRCKACGCKNVIRLKLLGCYVKNRNMCNACGHITDNQGKAPRWKPRVVH